MSVEIHPAINISKSPKSPAVKIGQETQCLSRRSVVNLWRDYPKIPYRWARISRQQACHGDLNWKCDQGARIRGRHPHLQLLETSKLPLPRIKNSCQQERRAESRRMIRGCRKRHRFRNRYILPSSCTRARAHAACTWANIRRDTICRDEILWRNIQAVGNHVDRCS
jgi:hypothetical protein